MDILGNILVILDHTTRYSEAIPLRAATVEEILTDQGIHFMPNVLKEMCKLLKVSQIRTSVYHPQTEGLVERFNQTLKVQ